ncbi:MAG TPA: hypothetical protein GX008_04700 [Firmicutes bacterium]|nr:hypothetical protein [Bacillota bacterium]
MRSRERLTRFFKGESVDRPPIWLLFPYHKVDYYADVYNNPHYREILAKVEEHDVDIFNRRNFDTGFCFNASKELEVEIVEERNGRDVVYHQVVRAQGREFEKSYTYRNGLTMTLKHFVESVEDLEAILTLPYEPPRPSLDFFFADREELGDRGLMMADPGDAVATVYHLCGPENFSLWSILEPERLQRALDEVHQRVMHFYRYLLEGGIGPVFFAVGAEFAGPPMIAPRDFWPIAGQRFKEMVDLVHSYGCFFILHYHGNIKQVLPRIREIGPDGVHTIEAPPVGDCTISEAREILGSEIALIGNVQYDDLRRLTPDEITKMVYSCLEEGAGGRFILSPTAGPYEEVISEGMIRNYIAFIEAGVEGGK